MEPRNLLSGIPRISEGEAFEELLACHNVSIERIVSAPGTLSEVFEQTQDEWVLVLQGSAKLKLDNRIHDLSQGDCLFIPAHAPHQVLETSESPLCTWLAVHIHPLNDTP
ncbi:MAG: cupin domain-containing protein [Sedimenticola sp.]